MNLVVGATGILGSEICRQLRARGLPVRALVRPGSAGAGALREIGAEIVMGDLRARTTIEAACRDVRAVYSTATAMGTKDKSLKMRDVDRDGQLALVEIAAASGVAHFVYVSATPVLTEKAPLIRYKREVERAIRSSGMRWTILQPSVFMEVWLSPLLGFDAAGAKAIVFGAGTAPMSWIAVADVAAHAVRALDDPRLANRDLPLGGPAGVAPNDVIALFERLGGRKFSVRHVPGALLAFMSPVVALINEGAASGMSMGAQSSHGDVIDTPLQRELALPLTTVEEYARRVVQR